MAKEIKTIGVLTSGGDAVSYALILICFFFGYNDTPRVGFGMECFYRPAEY